MLERRISERKKEKKHKYAMLTSNSIWKSTKCYRNLSWPSATAQRLDLVEGHSVFYILVQNAKQPATVRSTLCVTLDSDGLITATKTYQNSAHVNLTQSNQDGTCLHSSMSDTPVGAYNVVIFATN